MLLAALVCHLANQAAAVRCGGSVEQELETVAGAGAEQLLGVSIDVSIVA